MLRDIIDYCLQDGVWLLVLWGVYSGRGSKPWLQRVEEETRKKVLMFQVDIAMSLTGDRRSGAHGLRLRKGGPIGRVPKNPEGSQLRVIEYLLREGQIKKGSRLLQKSVP